jgi:threonine dehydrogenase-like Zn-dependent dehydrogenase
MKAVRRGTEGIELVDAPDPAPADDEVVVRMGAAGICGSDLKLAAFGPSAFTVGHELAGHLDDGTPVAIEPGVWCGQCDQCAKGRTNTCRRASIIGITRDGGMADAVSVPRRSLVPLPAGVAVKDASLVEPLAVAIHGLRLAGVEPGMPVGVVGGGSLGLCTVAAAVAMGCEVGLVARHPHQQAAGEQLGAGAPSGKYAVVAEVAGTDSAMAEAVRHAQPGGTVVLLSSNFDSWSIPGMDSMVRELRFVISFAYGRTATGREIDSAAALLAASPALGHTLITHRFPLEGAAEAFRVAADRASGAIKVVIEP